MTTTVLRQPTNSPLRSHKPVINVVGKGPKAYLRVEDAFTGACFGTLSGTKTMSNFVTMLCHVTRKRR